MRVMVSRVAGVLAMLVIGCGSGATPGSRAQGDASPQAGAPTVSEPAGSAKPAVDAQPAAEECEQRIRRLEEVGDRLTRESWRPPPEWIRHVELLHGTETWAMQGTEFDDQLRLPIIARGGHEIDRPTVKLTMKADGAIRFPWTQPMAADEQGPVYGEADIAGRLRRAIGRELRDGRPLLILADRSVAARMVARVCDSLPRGASARLAVRKPASTFVAEHVARFPFSPGWFTPVLERAYTARGSLHMLYRDATMTEALARAGGGCPGALKTIQSVKHGAGVDYGVPELVKAARRCACRDMDIEAIASAFLLFAVPGTTWARYVELPASIGRDGAFDLERGDVSTVADLAAALAAG
jgi:hypothetical protein